MSLRPMIFMVVVLTQPIVPSIARPVRNGHRDALDSPDHGYDFVLEVGRRSRQGISPSSRPPIGLHSGLDDSANDLENNMIPRRVRLKFRHGITSTEDDGHRTPLSTSHAHASTSHITLITPRSNPSHASSLSTTPNFFPSSAATRPDSNLYINSPINSSVCLTDANLLHNDTVQSDSSPSLIETQRLQLDPMKRNSIPWFREWLSQWVFRTFHVSIPDRIAWSGRASFNV